MSSVNLSLLICKMNMVLTMPAAAAAAKSLQLCPTLCDRKDKGPPGSPVPGIDLYYFADSHNDSISDLIDVANLLSKNLWHFMLTVPERNHFPKYATEMNILPFKYICWASLIAQLVKN